MDARRGGRPHVRSNTRGPQEGPPPAFFPAASAAAAHAQEIRARRPRLVRRQPGLSRQLIGPRARFLDASAGFGRPRPIRPRFVRGGSIGELQHEHEEPRHWTEFTCVVCVSLNEGTDTAETRKNRRTAELKQGICGAFQMNSGGALTHDG